MPRNLQNPIISFNNFSFQYKAQKKPTLNNINLDIFEGERVLIVGPSGSGKSTLSNCINGLCPFSYPGEISGTLTIDGANTSDLSIFELSRKVGTVLQDPDGQFIGLTVAEDIAFALENDCVEQNQMHRATLNAAKLVNIQNHLEHAPHELSGGQKQRVSLAGVMVDNVKILLFDEPLANLDPATGKQVIELIDDIQKQSRTTVLIVEHRLEDVLWRNVDRIVLIANGSIVASTTPDQLLAENFLAENGIREPLYITAAKYAGVDILSRNKPAHIESFLLSENDKNRVKNWFENNAPSPCAKNTDAYLQVKNLSFGYSKGKKNLQNISFAVGKGEMVSIIGQNGAGKSTLAKLICGFETPDEGELYLDGKNITRQTIRERAKKIGYVMQNPNQMISKPMIFDEVALSLAKSGLSQAEIKEKVEQTLKICGLYPFRNWPVSALSFGQKKRVTIASVLVMGCDLIILDEPTAGQDYKRYTEIMEFLCELNRKGVTILMITHDMHLMLEYTPRAIAFSSGELIADTSAAAVLCNANLVEKAALKETSLFLLAGKCGIPADQRVNFVQAFINHDREVRKNGC